MGWAKRSAALAVTVIEWLLFAMFAGWGLLTLGRDWSDYIVDNQTVTNAIKMRFHSDISGLQLLTVAVLLRISASLRKLANRPK